MAPRPSSSPPLRWSWAACLAAGLAVAAGPPPAPEPLPPRLSLNAAVRWALLYNPALAVQRQQQGIAAAGVVIADTYPFNPVSQNLWQAAMGPASAGVTYRVPVSEAVTWQVQVRGQQTYRRQRARAALSATEWQIARQEQLVVANVVRAYTSLLYQQMLLELLQDTLRFNEQLARDTRELMRAGKLHGTDLILAQSEAAAFVNPLSSAREAIAAARYGLFRALGVSEGDFQLDGSLESMPPSFPEPAMLALALERRGDLGASRATVAQAAANVRYTIANRFGNPTFGVAYGLDPTNISTIGAVVNFPIPIVNTQPGQILQSQAQHAQAVLTVRRTEVTVRQDVRSALARLDAARARVEVYRNQILPSLNRAVEDMVKLFRAGAPGSDALRVLDVRRKYLTARRQYINNLWRVSQDYADLIAAVGEPLLLDLRPCLPSPPPVQAPGTTP